MRPIAALDKARTLSPTAARIADLGVAWRDKGDLAKATALFREAVAKDPRYAPARWHLAQMLSRAAQVRRTEQGAGRSAVGGGAVGGGAKTA